MSDYVIEEYEHAGLTVKIVGDDENVSDQGPLDYPVGQWAVEYRGYLLGGDANIDPSELFSQTDDCPACPHSQGYKDPQKGDEECEVCEGHGYITVDPITYIKRHYGARVILPLFVLDHSGITIRAGGRLDTGADNLRSTNRFIGDADGWDTSTVGVIFDTAELRKEHGWEDFTDEQIEESLRAEVQAYAYHLEGYYTGYVIASETDDHLDSCWGFLGPEDYSGIKEAANDAAECCAREIKAEAERVHEAACRDIETKEVTA